MATLTAEARQELLAIDDPQHGLDCAQCLGLEPPTGRRCNPSRIEIKLRDKMVEKLKRFGLWQGPVVLDSLVRDHRLVSRLLDDSEGHIDQEWSYRTGGIARQILGARSVWESIGFKSKIAAAGAKHG